ncbi:MULTISPECIES: helix-turn-helix domain-containing protein [Burkholderia]|nr:MULTISPECIES: helix-turn-helix domain-containing protein [Burkholderia]GLZ22065.1 hypothetical protein Bpla01_55940 [Burkholderia plantarii]
MLKLVSEHGAEMALSSVARRTATTPSKAHRYIVSLVEHGIAQILPLGQTGETQRQTVTTHLNKIRSDLKLSHESLQFTDAK